MFLHSVRVWNSSPHRFSRSARFDLPTETGVRFDLYREKRRLITGPAVAETQRGEVKREAGERGACRAGYMFVAVGLLLTLLSSAGSLADAARGLETGAREELGLA